MRIGLICTDDPERRDGLSGTPYAVRRALLDAGASVRSFVPARQTGGRVDAEADGSNRPHGRNRPSFAARAARRARRTAQRTPPGRALAQRAMLRRVRRDAAPLRARIVDAVHAAEVDILLGCFASGLLYELDAPAPIVHFSDLTFRLAEQTYPWARSMPRWRREATDAVERDALTRADAVVVPTQWVRDSVVADYDVAPERVRVIPLGANLCEDQPPGGARDDTQPPSRADLRLTITAANPRRKRLDLAVDAVAALRRRRWRATLTCVGGSTEKARACPFVRCVGRLDHDDPRDRARHIRILRRSHLMILPSEAEAYGIAPIEAARVGRPSVVSAAGGLPEVVRHGRTGRVVPVGATAGQYARAVERLVEDVDAYRRCCTAAERRARTTLNWNRFGKAMLEVLAGACTAGRTPRQGPPAPCRFDVRPTVRRGPAQNAPAPR